jgi:hypothetical protein
MASNCKLARLDPQTTHDMVRDRFAANVMGGAPIIPESNEYYVIKNEYLAAELARDFVELYWKEQDPRYACCDNLVDYAAKRQIYPRPASFSQGYVLIKGVAGSPTSSTMQFQFGANTYAVGAAYPMPTTMPAVGSLVVRVQAMIAGSAGNAPLASAVGSVVSPATGIDPVATVYGSKFCGGMEAEACEPFRTRVLAREAFKPKMLYGDIIDIVGGYPCVTRVLPRSGACCENCESGCDCNSGGVQLYAMMDDTFEFGLIPEWVADEITTWAFGEKQGAGQGKVDVGICGKVYFAKPALVDVVIDGLACLTPSQVALIRSRITEAFSELVPSVGLCTKTIDFIVTQVAGGACGSGASFESDSSNVTFHPGCGDIEPNCDFLICLGSIKFV